MERVAGTTGAELSARAEFAVFYDKELGGQVRRAFLLVGSNEVANDVVHDGFVAVYRRWGELAEPGAYLNRVVLNGCRDHFRQRQRQARLLPRVASTAQMTAVSDTLDDVLSGLPFNQRAAIVLRFYAELSVAEIADALGCRPGSVGPWINRGLQRMRKALS